VEFVNFRAQDRACEAEIDARIRKVLDHGCFVLGPEFDELEATLCPDVASAV
jgi:UDP-2-acetamido-2-deoxy-ribo-hexuluronate aminotransferase